MEDGNLALVVCGSRSGYQQDRVGLPSGHIPITEGGWEVFATLMQGRDVIELTATGLLGRLRWRAPSHLGIQVVSNTACSSRSNATTKNWNFLILAIQPFLERKVHWGSFSHPGPLSKSVISVAIFESCIYGSFHPTIRPGDRAKAAEPAQRITGMGSPA